MIIAIITLYSELPKIIGIIIILSGFGVVALSNKIIKKWYSKKMYLKIDENIFIIELTDLTDEIIEKYNIPYEELLSYSIGVNGSNSYYYEFTIYIDKTKHSYVFKCTEETNKALTTFNNKIVDINNTRFKNKIDFKDSFFATPKGLLTIQVFTLLFIIAFIAHVIYIPKSSFGTLIISLGTLFQLIGLRNSGLRISKKINSGEALNF